MPPRRARRTVSTSRAALITSTSSSGATSRSCCMRSSPLASGRWMSSRTRSGCSVPGLQQRLGAGVGGADNGEAGRGWMNPAWTFATMKSSSTIRTVIMRAPSLGERGREDGAAVVVHSELAAAALAHHPRKREPVAAVALARRPLGGEALAENGLQMSSGGTPGPGVPDRDARPVAAVVDQDVDRGRPGVPVTASRALSTRLPTTVVRSREKSSLTRPSRESGASWRAPRVRPRGWTWR